MFCYKDLISDIIIILVSKGGLKQKRQSREKPQQIEEMECSQQLNLLSNMKTSEMLTLLWDSTCYHVLAQPGRNQAKLVMDMLQKTLEIFSVFHHSLQIHFNKSYAEKLCIPVMQNFRDQMMEARVSITNFLEQQAHKISSILHRQAEYMFILDNSEEEAKEEFTLHTYNFLMKENLSCRKLKSILDDSRAASLEQNAKISMFGKSQFERWCANYSVRSHEFFLQVYSTKWKQTLHNISYSKLKNQQQLKSFTFNGQSTTTNNQDTGKSSKQLNHQLHKPVQESIKSNQMHVMSEKLPLHKSKNVFIDEEYSIPGEMAMQEEKDLIKQIFNEIEQDNMYI